MELGVVFSFFCTAVEKIAQQLSEKNPVRFVFSKVTFRIKARFQVGPGDWGRKNPLVVHVLPHGQEIAAKDGGSMATAEEDQGSMVKDQYYGDDYHGSAADYDAGSAAQEKDYYDGYGEYDKEAGTK